jgi:hypothetical protein
MYNRFDLPEQKNIMVGHPFIYNTNINSINWQNILLSPIFEHYSADCFSILRTQNSINFPNPSFLFP